MEKISFVLAAFSKLPYMSQSFLEFFFLFLKLHVLYMHAHSTTHIHVRTCTTYIKLYNYEFGWPIEVYITVLQKVLFPL